MDIINQMTSSVTKPTIPKSERKSAISLGIAMSKPGDIGRNRKAEKPPKPKKEKNCLFHIESINEIINKDNKNNIIKTKRNDSRTSPCLLSYFK